jgi:hypothetical protein
VLGERLHAGATASGSCNTYLCNLSQLSRRTQLNSACLQKMQAPRQIRVMAAGAIGRFC